MAQRLGGHGLLQTNGIGWRITMLIRITYDLFRKIIFTVVSFGSQALLIVITIRGRSHVLLMTYEGTKTNPGQFVNRMDRTAMADSELNDKLRAR